MNWIILYDRHTNNDYFDDEFKTCVPIPSEIETRNEAIEWFCKNISFNFGNKYRLINVSHVEVINTKELELFCDRIREDKERIEYERLKQKFERA